MLDPQLFALAASGLVPPDVVARWASMSLTDLQHHHGAEIAAAQASFRSEALRQLLLGVFTDHAPPAALAVALAIEDDAWARAVPDPHHRRQLRGSLVHRLLKLTLSGRHVEACQTLLGLSDDTWRSVLDALGLRFCDPHRNRFPDDARARLRQHLGDIVADARARPGPRRQAGQVLLRALR